MRGKKMVEMCRTSQLTESDEKEITTKMPLSATENTKTVITAAKNDTIITNWNLAPNQDQPKIIILQDIKLNNPVTTVFKDICPKGETNKITLPSDMTMNNSFENLIENAEIIFDDLMEIQPAVVANHANSNVKDGGENHENENDHSDVNRDGSSSNADEDGREKHEDENDHSDFKRDGSSSNGDDDSETEAGSKRKVNKQLRMAGKEYVGFRRPRNQKRTYQDINRSERILKERCKSKSCQRSKTRMCNEISEAVRKQIFSHFWDNLDWRQRKILICNLVSQKPTQRQTTGEEISRRSSSLFYSLNIGAKTVSVCKTMFLNTLSLGEWSVRTWVKESQFGISVSSKNSGRSSKRQKLTESDEFIKAFLEQLPKLPSHYCRRDTKKLFLEQDFKSFADLYEKFIEYSKENQKKTVTRNTFMKWIKKLDIGIFKPRKDRCDTCVEFEAGNLSKDMWDIHIKRKNRAQKEKQDDKEEARKGNCHVMTMDLQAVKTCPSLQASSLYFKTKLVCHNFTFFDLNTKDATCYWFDETDADLQASTFASMVVSFLISHYISPAETVETIVLYSDGCTYQNRNSVLANALLSLSYQYKVTIIQKFLVKGHTQMECDSVHATIEKRLKNRTIEIPNDYFQVTKDARRNPKPYEVICPTYNFFQNFNTNLVYDSIRPGKKTNDPTVTQISALKYEEGIISYKLDLDQEFSPLPHRPKHLPKRIEEYPPLFERQLPITKKKFGHLQEIKSKINKKIWSFYDNLPYKE